MLVFYFDHKGHSWVTRSVTSSCFPSATVVCMPFVAFGSASLFICVRIRFGSCNNYNRYLAGFCIASGPSYLLWGKMLCFVSRLFVF